MQQQAAQEKQRQQQQDEKAAGNDVSPSSVPLLSLAPLPSASSSSPPAGFTFAPSAGTPPFARFNQTASCVCVVVSAGCAVYSVRPFGVCVSYGRAVSAAWGLVELRYESSLLAVCGSGLSSSLSPRTVQLLDARTVRVMSELSFAGGVLDVRLTGERLVCVLTDKVHVFDLRSLRQLYSLSATLTARGACAVVPFEQPPTSTSTAFIAVPSHSTRGDANVYSYDGQLLAAVHAHSSAIRMLALSGDGRLMATCSLSGTLIRLFSLPNGTKLLTLRRGTLSSHVTCLAFNRRASRLCVASRDSTTVHIFNLPGHTHSPHSVSSSAGASVGSWPVASLVRQSVASLSSLSSLSGRLEDFVEPNRGDALISLKSGNEPLAVSFTGSASSVHDAIDELLHVVTRTGALFTYALSGSNDAPVRLLSVQFLHSDPVAVQSLSVEPTAIHSNG